jgi:molybdenum cofactor cytidylyltransferase
VLPGVVLAGGDSTRMGSPKAILTAPGGLSFVSRIVTTLHHAGVTDVVVVTGRHHEAIVDVIARSALPMTPRILRNIDPSRGQLSSLLVAMDAVVTESTDGLLVTLVDVPLVDVETVKTVIAAWRRTRAPIVRPAIGDEHGHPVIFDRVLFDEIRSAPLDAGAKSVVRAHASAILNVQVEDEGSLRDIDTPADYEAIRDE